jgi:hypothetical protein
MVSQLSFFLNYNVAYYLIFLKQEYGEILEQWCTYLHHMPLTITFRSNADKPSSSYPPNRKHITTYVRTYICRKQQYRKIEGGNNKNQDRKLILVTEGGGARKRRDLPALTHRQICQVSWAAVQSFVRIVLINPSQQRALPSTPICRPAARPPLPKPTQASRNGTEQAQPDERGCYCHLAGAGDRGGAFAGQRRPPSGDLSPSTAAPLVAAPRLPHLQALAPPHLRPRLPLPLPRPPQGASPPRLLRRRRRRHRVRAHAAPARPHPGAAMANALTELGKEDRTQRSQFGWFEVKFRVRGVRPRVGTRASESAWNAGRGWNPSVF